MLTAPRLLLAAPQMMLAALQLMLTGDPTGGSTRVVTQNQAGKTFWVGKQPIGEPFVPFWDVVGAVGFYDYGSMTMARTLGSNSPNQVAENGRRVLIGWLGSAYVGTQSLARDLSLSTTHELLQAFVPELQQLRVPGSARHSSKVGANPAEPIRGSMQMEVRFSFC